MEELHIGAKIKEIFEESGMSISEFGRRINFTRENVYSIFNRKTIDTGLLLSISDVLKFDFFSLYIQRINPNLYAEIDRLKKEIEYLEEINALLKAKSGKNK